MDTLVSAAFRNMYWAFVFLVWVVKGFIYVLSASMNAGRRRR